MGTLSSTILGYIDAAFGSGERGSARPSVAFVCRFRPRRLSDGAIVPLFASAYGYDRVLSVTPDDATTFTVAATGKTVTRSAGSYLDEDFYVGAVVKMAGWSNAGNNREDFEVTALSDLVMTFGNSTTLVNEGPTAGSAGVSITYHHPSPPRLVVPQLACSIINQGWGTDQGSNRPSPLSDQFIELEQFRLGILEAGEIELHHADHDLTGDGTGALNDWATAYSWGDAEALIYVGRVIDPWSAWLPCFPFRVVMDPTWNRGQLSLLIKGPLVNLNAPAQTAILEADEVAGTLAAFGDPANRPDFGVAFTGLQNVDPAGGYTELGDEIAQGAGGAVITLGAAWHATSPDTSPAAVWSSPGAAGMIALELEASGTIAANHLLTNASGYRIASKTFASVSPTGNALIRIYVATSRYSDDGNPSVPTSVTGNGITYALVTTNLFDSTGSGGGPRGRISLYRGMAASPSAGGVTVNMGGEIQNEIAIAMTEFTNVTTGSNGANAIVQAITQTLTESAVSGTASTAIGQTKPVTLGRCRSVPCARTNSTHYIVSDALDGIEDIETVWEAPGVDITDAVVEDLANAGFIVEGRGQMVVDVKGEKFDGGSYSAEQGAVANELLDRNGFSGALNASDVAALTSEIGDHIYADNPGLIREHLEWALKPLHHAYPEQDGSEYRILTLHDPTGETADVELDYAVGDIADIERLATAPPTCRVRVGYQIQWELLRGLQDGVTEDSRLFNRTPWKHSPIAGDDAAVLANYPNALRLSILSPLYDPDEAQAAADTLHGIFSVRRDVIRVKLAKKLLYAWIGDYVSVTYPGYGLESGKTMLCVGVEFDIEGSAPNVWLTLWG